MMQMLTNLKCRDYEEPGNIIIDDDKPVREFVIVAKGCCNLVGKFRDSKNQQRCAVVVQLPAQSWYGDFQIILNMKSTFELSSGVPMRRTKRMKKQKDFKTQIFTIGADKFRELLDEDAEFKRCVTLRATKRRAHFLSILKEIESYCELSMKYGYEDLGEDTYLIGKIFGEAAVSTYRPPKSKGKQDARSELASEFIDNPFELELKKDPYTRHSPEELDEELHINVKTKIGRVLRELKKMTLYKLYNPYSLRLVVKTIDYGYITLTREEKNDVKKNKRSLDSSYKSIQSLFDYTSIINQNMAETVNNMMQLTKEQWSDYMSSMDHWMVNFYHDDDVALSDQWARITNVGEILIKRGISNTQSRRSYSQC